jgi:hypothetical protein
MISRHRFFKFALLLTFFVLTSSLFSQIGFQDYEFDSTKTYKISHTEGLDFIGTFQEKKGEIVIFENEMGSKTKFLVENITRIRIVAPSNKSFSKPDELKPLFQDVEPAASLESPLLFMDLGVSGSKKVSLFGLGTTLILSKNYGFSFDFHFIAREAMNLPPNYKPGPLCLFNCAPKDRLQTFSVNFRYEIPSSIKAFRLGVEPGISYVNSRIIQFEPYSSSWPYWETSNYLKSTLREKGMGFNFNIKAEFPFTQYVGAEFAIVSNTNPYQSYIGWKICLTMGYIRN